MYWSGEYSSFKSSVEFNEWWDAEKFNWNKGSFYLLRYYSDYFNEWWDSEKFNWGEVIYLVKYCWDYRNIWCQNKRGRDYLFYNLREYCGDHGYLSIVKVNNGN